MAMNFLTHVRPNPDRILFHYRIRDLGFFSFSVTNAVLPTRFWSYMEKPAVVVLPFAYMGELVSFGR